MRRVIALFFATLLLVIVAGAALAAGPLLKASPSSVNFGTRPVGSISLKATRLTNRSDATINIFVTVAAEPDDFSFGLLPGSTCPVLAPAALARGESCDAVAQFRPTEFFAGQHQTATLLATATDPTSGTVLATVLIDFTGTGKVASLAVTAFVAM
jgi:hypothetical protein